MATLSKAIQDLEDQRRQIDSALKILRDLNANGHMLAPGGRKLTPEGRLRIAEAQKRRWARERAGKSRSK